MRFRRKLQLLFALTVMVCISAVAAAVSYFARRSFEQASKARTAALIFRFERELAETEGSIQRRVEAIATSPTATRMAVALNQGSIDYGEYLNEAGDLADLHQLDFLDFVDDHGTILSSAVWPAKFGYKTTAPLTQSQKIFFQREDLPDGAVLGLCALSRVTVGQKSLFVIGGQRIDRKFIGNMAMPAGMRALLYEDLGPGAGPPHIIDPFGLQPATAPVASVIEKVRSNPRENAGLVHWSSNAESDEMVYATPMFGADQKLLGALLITDSLRPYVELRRQIRYLSLLVGGLGILLAIASSAWAATRVTRPVEQLASAARRVASGDWSAQVEVSSTDELAGLAQSFNHMTHELQQQRDRLLQAERVAAWRELARRLAHELKNPLFPLQLTVENLVRARQQSPGQFDETFRESSSTLLGEIANLKTIVSRFSEFSKMPEPHFERVQLNEVVQDVARLFQAQFNAPGRPAIKCRLELASSLDPIAADPELLHRAISNLVLNAIEAMPGGGVLTLRTSQDGGVVSVQVLDTGSGLTAEERERLFTPYFTNKTHGTGLGLAIVQSIVSDHGGKISVQSLPGSGTTFTLELPRNNKREVAEATTSAN